VTHEPENTPQDDWEVEDVEIDRPVSVVVSVRLPGELGDRLAVEASTRGIGVSALVREAVAQYLESAEAVRTSYDWSVSSSDVSVFFYAGRSIQGRTAGSARTLDEALLSRP
jgi:Ribbon-helix-helix protein, copG family